MMSILLVVINVFAVIKQQVILDKIRPEKL